MDIVQRILTIKELVQVIRVMVGHGYQNCSVLAPREQKIELGEGKREAAKREVNSPAVPLIWHPLYRCLDSKQRDPTAVISLETHFYTWVIKMVLMLDQSISIY